MVFQILGVLTVRSVRAASVENMTIGLGQDGYDMEAEAYDANGAVDQTAGVFCPTAGARLYA